MNLERYLEISEIDIRNLVSKFDFEDKEDMYQECVITAWGIIEQNKITDETELRKYIYAAMRNKLLSKKEYLSAKKRDFKVGRNSLCIDDCKSDIGIPINSNEDDMLLDQNKLAAIEKAFCRSKHKERDIKVVTMLEQGYSLKKIADEVGCIYQYVQRTRGKYREALAQVMGMEYKDSMLEYHRGYYKRYNNENKEKVSENYKSWYKRVGGRKK